MSDYIYVRKYFLYFLPVILFYFIGFFFNIKDGYASGDEIGFLSAFADRGAENEFDWRYFIWTGYLSVLSKISLILPLIVNFIVILLLLFSSINKKQLSLELSLIMVLLPSVFYFLNSYLRDVVFLLSSVWLLIVFNGKKINLIKFNLVMLIVFTIRPLYAVIYSVGVVFSHVFFLKYFKVLIFFIFIFFILCALMVYSSDYVYTEYFNFFYFGHLRGKEYIGTSLVKLTDFDQAHAAINFFLSPLYFWFVPASGIGQAYDIILYLENGLYLFMFFLVLYSLSFDYLMSDRVYRLSFIIVLLSFFVAAATTTHADVYRFRLVFIPFLFYLFSKVKFLFFLKNTLIFVKK